MKQWGFRAGAIERRQDHHLQIDRSPRAFRSIFKDGQLPAKQFLIDSRELARLQRSVGFCFFRRRFRLVTPCAPKRENAKRGSDRGEKHRGLAEHYVMLRDFLIRWFLPLPVLTAFPMAMGSASAASAS
jgi:hypothetical protein